MTQKEKAERYDEVVKQIKECIPDENGFITIYPREFFPELKESEDERIRKKLIDYFSDSHATDTFRGIAWERIVAWLEKQGEPKSYWKPSKEEMDALYGLAYITNKMDDKKDEAITKLYQDLKREFFGVSYENMFIDAPIKLEKQGEQKSADKVETKNI